MKIGKRYKFYHQIGDVKPEIVFHGDVASRTGTRGESILISRNLPDGCRIHLLTILFRKENGKPGGKQRA